MVFTIPNKRLENTHYGKMTDFCMGQPQLVKEDHNRLPITTLAREMPGSNTISTYPGSELNVAKAHLNIMDV